YMFFFFSSRRRHTRSKRDWSSDVCSSDLNQLSSGSERICFSKIDITNPYEVKKWVDDIIERHGHIDVLFNNAGISAVGLLHEIDESIWEKVFSVNVTGSYLTSKNILPIMMKQNYGSIINMSSCVAEMGLAERSVY